MLVCMLLPRQDHRCVTHTTTRTTIENSIENSDPRTNDTNDTKGSGHGHLATVYKVCVTFPWLILWNGIVCIPPIQETLHWTWECIHDVLHQKQKQFVTMMVWWFIGWSVDDDVLMNSLILDSEMKSCSGPEVCKTHVHMYVRAHVPVDTCTFFLYVECTRYCTRSFDRSFKKFIYLETWGIFFFDEGSLS